MPRLRRRDDLAVLKAREQLVRYLGATPRCVTNDGRVATRVVTTCRATSMRRAVSTLTSRSARMLTGARCVCPRNPMSRH